MRLRGPYSLTYFVQNIVLSSGAYIFQKFGSYFKNLGARMVTKTKRYTERP
jgi:hypothetical protein